MARYTLVYGVRLIPEGTLKGVDEATLKLADGSTRRPDAAHLRRHHPAAAPSLDRSLDAFFDLLPGADEEDLEEVRRLSAAAHAASLPTTSSTCCSSPRRSRGCWPSTTPGSPWVFITAAVSLVPLAGLIGLGTEQLARRSGPGARRLPERHVRQRRRADHRDRRAAQRHTSSWSKPRSPAASSATCCSCSALSFFVGGLGRPLAEVPSHRGDQHDGDAVSRASSRSSCRRCSTCRVYGNLARAAAGASIA